jgi:hypothetical protein
MVLLASMGLVLTMILPAFSQTAVPAATRQRGAPGNTAGMRLKGKIHRTPGQKESLSQHLISEARLDSPISATERKAVEHCGEESVSAQKGLQIVNVPDTADFAVLVRTSTGSGAGERGPNFSLALDDDAEVSVDVTVRRSRHKAGERKFRTGV